MGLKGIERGKYGSNQILYIDKYICVYILTKVEEEIAKRDSMYITAYLLNYWHG